MGHVVAVPHEREDPTLGRPEAFLDREQVGERLARVLEVGQRVDHRHVGRAGQRLEPLLFEGAEHDRVDVARQHAPGVLDRLTPAELKIRRRQGHRVTAELRHPDLERHAGPRGGLLEDQRHGPARHRIRMQPRVDLHPGRQGHHAAELRRGQVVDRQEVTGHAAGV